MKPEYTLLTKLFSGNQMPEILRFVNERNAFDNINEFEELIWEEISEDIYFKNIEERNRIIKNALILSQNWQNYDSIHLLKLVTQQLKEFQKTNGYFTISQLKNLWNYCDYLVEEHVIDNGMISSNDIQDISDMHWAFFYFIKLQMLKTNKPIKSYWPTYSLGYYYENSFFNASDLDALVTYIYYTIDQILNDDDTDKLLLAKPIFLNDLKHNLKKTKSEFEKDDEFFEIYEEEFNLKFKPKLTDLLLIILEKKEKKLYETSLAENTNNRLRLKETTLNIFEQI